MAMRIKLHERNMPDFMDDVKSGLESIEGLVKLYVERSKKRILPSGRELTLTFDCPKGPITTRYGEVEYQLLVFPYVYNNDGRIVGNGGKDDIAYTITADVDANYNINVNFKIQRKVFTDKGTCERFTFDEDEIGTMVDTMVTAIVDDLEQNYYIG